jgi:hypothetical protein
MNPIRLVHHYQEAVAGLTRMQRSFDQGNYDTIEELSRAVSADIGKLQALSSDYAPVAVELLRGCVSWFNAPASGWSLRTKGPL